MRRWVITCVLVWLLAAPALADTTSGVAAYERGDYATALKLLKPEAENGDALAQVTYGLMFAKGLGVPRDPAQAVAWFHKAAEQGNAQAQYDLGVAYDIGDAGSQDRAQAIAWYRKAANQGYVDAQYNLGHLLVNEGAEEQYEEGAAWLLKAAEQGKADAMHVYGSCCGAGRGVDQNMLCARYWLSKAAAAGSARSKDTLSHLESLIAELEANGAPRTAGGDGSSKERAIILTDAKSETQGVKAEHLVAKYYFRDWRWGMQSLLNDANGHMYDMIELTRSGKTKPVYFDISNWFGKL